jgi:hypothetical protein
MSINKVISLVDNYPFKKVSPISEDSLDVFECLVFLHSCQGLQPSETAGLHLVLEYSKKPEVAWPRSGE